MNFNIFSNFSRSKIFGGNITDTNILIKYLNNKNHNVNFIHVGIDKINENYFYKIARRIRNFIYFSKTKSDFKTINFYFISGFYSLLEKILFIKLFQIKNKHIFFLRAGVFFTEIERSNFKKYLLRILYSNDFIYITQGDKFKNKLNNISKNKILISSNWVINDNFDIQKKIKLDNIIPSFVFMGWFTKEKGIYEIIDFITYCNENKFICKFIFIGNGPLINFINELSFPFIKIEIISNQDYLNFQHILKKSDFFILLSHNEGLPNALFEAMQFGLIPIVTDVGCISDYIKNNDNGFIFKNNIDLFNDIKKILSNKTLKKNILNSIYNFNITNNSTLLLDQLYYNLINITNYEE